MHGCARQASWKLGHTKEEQVRCVGAARVTWQSRACEGAYAMAYGGLAGPACWPGAKGPGRAVGLVGQ